MPISDCWPALEPSLDLLDPPTHKRITSLHNHLLPHASDIANYASSLHKSHLPCTLITSAYTWGQSFLVYELLFEDDSSWVVRFGLPPYEGDEFFNTPEQLERKILNEVGALKIVKERTAVPVPEIFGYHPRHGRGFQRIFSGASAESGPGGPEATQPKVKPHPLGEDFPAFIMMAALRGKTIEECGIPVHELGGHWETSPSDPSYAEYLDSPILQNYLASLASIHIQLSQITFPQIGSFTIDEETGEVKIGPMAEFGLGPFDDAEEYYGVMVEAFKRIAEASLEVEEEEEEEEDNDYEVVIKINDSDMEEAGQQLSLSNQQVKALRRAFTASLFPLALSPHISSANNAGPFPLRHGDLHSENILVDEETGHIVGVIDWEGAGTVPWEVAAGLNWEVQGEAMEWQRHNDSTTESRTTIIRPDIHSAFNQSLTDLEKAMKERLHKKPPTKITSAPPPLDLRKIVRSPPSTAHNNCSCTSLASPSSSCTSLSSSESSLSNHSFSSLDVSSSENASRHKGHSRCSSTSTNLTALTTPATSPASSDFDLIVPKDPSILDTPTGVQDSTPQRPGHEWGLTVQKSSPFGRVASEPAARHSPQTTPSHARTVSLSPAIIEAIREPLPADYRKQAKQYDLSLGVAAMVIADASKEKEAGLSLHPNRSPSPLTSPSHFPVPSPHYSGLSRAQSHSHRMSMHRRRQSSMALSMSPGASPGASPLTPLHAPPMWGSLSLPPFPLRSSPSGSPTPSPLATPQALPTSYLHHQSPFLGQRTPSHSRVPSAYLAPSLSRHPSGSENTSTSTMTPTPPSPLLPSDFSLALDNPPVKSPCGLTLSELHHSVATYVASYLGHWMYVYGCEYDILGKALWEVVSHHRKEDKSLDEAFWAWVHESIKEELGGEEVEVNQVGEGRRSAEALPAKENTVLEEPADTTIQQQGLEKQAAAVPALDSLD